MSNNYKIRELRIELRPGVILVADVESVDAANKLLKELQEGKVVSFQQRVEDLKIKREEKSLDSDSPMSRLEVRAELPNGSLQAKDILAFKDDVPQLLRPSIFTSVSDAALVLLYAIEGGLQTKSIGYESFKNLYDSQNIKSGSPLTMLLTNLRNVGYLNRKAYSTNRTLSLTAKGDKKAREVLKGLVG